MIPMSVLGRYAQSLADVARELNDVEGVGRDLAMYREIFLAVPEVLQAFDSPAVPRDAKEKVLLELLSRYPVKSVTGNFLRLLLLHNRIFFFDQIYQLYIRTIDERKGIVSAKVSTATPLSEKEMSSLREALSKATGKIIRLDVHIDSGLLGGLVVQIGSTIYDGSIRKQLAEMRKYLTEGRQG
jgi:F-type H+-transporting ATPase subunit delta